MPDPQPPTTQPDQPLSIPRPATNPPNVYDDVVQRAVREAQAAAERRDTRPYRDRAGSPADPSLSPDAGRFGFGGPRK
jgi:hypothetical protein